jgi:hypothetical protein
MPTPYTAVMVKPLVFSFLTDKTSWTFNNLRFLRHIANEQHSWDSSWAPASWYKLAVPHQSSCRGFIDEHLMHLLLSPSLAWASKTWLKPDRQETFRQLPSRTNIHKKWVETINESIEHKNPCFWHSSFLELDAYGCTTQSGVQSKLCNDQRSILAIEQFTWPSSHQ